MGASNSKIDEDKALTLCRARKRFVKQALDGRCLLAAAHVSYVLSLRNTGAALTKFAQVLDETSPHAGEPFSSADSPPPSGKFHVNHMAAARIPSVTIEETPPVLLTATVQTLSPTRCSELHSNNNYVHVNHMKSAKVPSTTFEERPPTLVRAVVEASSSSRSSQPHLEENSSSEGPPPPGTPPWDYFGLFHPLDNQFSIEEGKMVGHRFDNADDIRHLREKEGIPELEDEDEQASSHRRDDDSIDSGDDFDQISDEPFVQIYKNRNDGFGDPSTNASLAIPTAGSITSENDEGNEENFGSNIGLHHDEETSLVKFMKTSAAVELPMNGKEKENGYESKSIENFLSCIKEIEILFLKASESGGEVPRMLEANKLQIRPLFTEEIAHKWKASTFFTACFTCGKEEVHVPQAPASNEMKYLPWHGSMSFRSSSSSKIPLGATSKDDAEDSSSNLFDGACMNSGSHASTLDRLYAWERKLYDEVKASGFIRREYDLKCRMLRIQDSRAESAYKIDKTRAAVKDLHSRIRVSIHRISSISKLIEDLRDKELQPQLEELIGGLTRMWAMMLECHQNQHKIISNATNNKGNRKVSVLSESHRHATMLLQFELSSLCSNFTKWIAAHKSYLKAMNNWLLKCILMAPAPKHKSSKKKPPPFSPTANNAPPIFVTCRDWLALMDELPEKQVEDAISDLIEAAALFLPHTEKTSGSLTSMLSLRRRDNGGEQYEKIERNEVSVDWSLNYDSLLAGLVAFFDRLEAFAQFSLVKYEALQKTISEARLRYENSDIRRSD